MLVNAWRHGRAARTRNAKSQLVQQVSEALDLGLGIRLEKVERRHSEQRVLDLRQPEPIELHME